MDIKIDEQKVQDAVQDTATKAVTDALDEGFELFGIPESMRAGVRRYVEGGILPGGFLTAILQNDLVGAIRAADRTNLPRIADFVGLLYDHTPSLCWGSPTKVREWTTSRRRPETP